MGSFYPNCFGWNLLFGKIFKRMRIIKMMNKKGEGEGPTWSVSTVSGLIAMLLIFSVLLFFVSGFKPYEQVDKKVCHESVVYKATVPETNDIKVVNIPLICKTEKICFASSVLDSPLSWDNCDDHYQGEEYDTIRIGGSVEERQKEINRVIAEKMAECWSMMGEGKLNIYSRGVYDQRYCNICTRFAFGKALSGKIGGEFNGTQRYLTTHIVPNTKKTFWQYVTNSESNYIYGYTSDNDTKITTPKAIIFMESDRNNFVKWASTIAGGVLGGLIGTAVGPLTASLGVGIGGALGKDFGDTADKYFTKDVPRVSSMNIVDYDRETLKQYGCTSFEGQIS